MRDFFNREIKPGDTVVYPVRQGSRLWQNAASVQSVTEDTCSVVKHDTGRMAKLTVGKNVINMGANNVTNPC